MYYKVSIDTSDHRLGSTGKYIDFKRLLCFREKTFMFGYYTIFRILSARPKLDYLCVNCTKRRYSENQYREISTAYWGLATTNQPTMSSLIWDYFVCTCFSCLSHMVLNECLSSINELMRVQWSVRLSGLERICKNHGKQLF